MTRRLPVLFLLLFLLGFIAATGARADIWRWMDASGDWHYVDSNQAIFTWTDEIGKVHYSDKPDHEDAVRVQLFWHSPGSLADLDKAKSGQAEEVGAAYPGETADQRADREAVVARNCQRANEILHAYRNAPKLYRTDEAGNRHILTESEHAAELEAARRKTEFLCSQ